MVLVATSSPAAQKINIGILTDGPSEGFQQIESLFIEEILNLTEGEFDVEFDVAHRRQADWTAGEIQSSFQDLQKDPDVDMILALGFVSSLIVSRSESISKPTFAPLVIDSNLLGLPRDNNASGKKNLNYLTEEVRFTDDVLAFREIVDFKHLALIVDQTIFESIPELAEQGRAWAESMGATMTYVLNNSADESLVEKIPPDIDAVMVAAVPRLTPKGRLLLISELINRRLPSYSLIGTTPVEKGMLAASAPDSDWSRLARKNALNLQAVLLGENPENQPVAFRHKRQLTINMETARKIEVFPRFDVLSTAVVLHEDDINGITKWSLSDVAHESLISNLDIQSSITSVNAAAELEQQAKSVMRPQFNTSIGVVQLEDDNASVISGIVAERTTSAAINATQIIYSESTLANIKIQRLVQQGREFAHRALELDIIQQATVGFLNILKAQTFIDIQRRTLNLSRTNLDLARDRVQSGSSVASDVFRLESEVATSRQNLLAARAQLEQAMDGLNKILHRPIGERFRTTPASLLDPSLLVSRQDLVNIIDNQRAFNRMGELFISQGIYNSPEIKQLEYQIASSERQLKSNQRSFWSPEVSLSGQVSNIINEDPLLASSDEGESDWQLSLNVSLPLFAGGSRRSKVRQSEYELYQLTLQRDSAAENIEVGVRANLHEIRASYPSIELARKAADAAKKNLELVQDNYSTGTMSIIDFLDARDASLNAEQNATNAVYDFLIDLMNLQRSTAVFDFFLDSKEMQRTVDEIKNYVSKP